MLLTCYCVSYTVFYRVVRRGCVAGRVAGREGLGLLGRSRMPKANRPFFKQQHPARFSLNPALPILGLIILKSKCIRKYIA